MLESFKINCVYIFNQVPKNLVFINENIRENWRSAMVRNDTYPRKPYALPKNHTRENIKFRKKLEFSANTEAFVNTINYSTPD